MPQRNQEKDSNSGVNLVEIWGSWIRVKKISISTGKFQIFQAILQKNIEFCRKIFENFDFFQVIKTIDLGPTKQKKSIYSYLWANYSISLQKSPLSNILPCT